MQRSYPLCLTVSEVRAILRPMRVLSDITLLATLVLPTATFAEVQTFTAMHTYILGDHDSKDDARQWCLLETKRKILEQAGVYVDQKPLELDIDPEPARREVAGTAGAFVVVPAAPVSALRADRCFFRRRNTRTLA